MLVWFWPIFYTNGHDQDTGSSLKASGKSKEQRFIAVIEETTFLHVRLIVVFFSFWLKHCERAGIKKKRNAIWKQGSNINASDTVSYSSLTLAVSLF